MARTESRRPSQSGIDRAHGDGTDPNYPEQHGAFSDRRDVQRVGAHALARDAGRGVGGAQSMTVDRYRSALSLPRINVGISSPGDVAKERAAAARVLMRWNAQRHHGAMPNALGWESATVPTLGDHPQNIVNEDIIRRCQLLVAIFWSTIGTPTPSAPSGTVDEINEFIRLKGPKRVMLYLCARPVPPRAARVRRTGEPR